MDVRSNQLPLYNDFRDKVRCCCRCGNCGSQHPPPHPFVLKVSFAARRRFQKGDVLQVGVVLYGAAVNTYPYVLRAMEEAGERGFGRNRLSFRLENISRAGLRQDDWAPGEAYPVPGVQGPPQASGFSCHWDFTTPLRLRSGGKPVDHRMLAPGDLAMPVLRRLMLLVQHYGNPRSIARSSRI